MLIYVGICRVFCTNISRCSVKKVFLKMSQILQENTCDWVSFWIRLHALTSTLLKSSRMPLVFWLFLLENRNKACNFIKKILQHKCFPVNFVKFGKTSFLQNSSCGCGGLNGQELFEKYWPQPALTCSKSTVETRDDVVFGVDDVFLVSLLLTLKIFQTFS